MAPARIAVPVGVAYGVDLEQVRGFRLLPRELNQDDGELTATQKVRRRAVMEGWGPLIEEIYR